MLILPKDREYRSTAAEAAKCHVVSLSVRKNRESTCVDSREVGDRDHASSLDAQREVDLVMGNMHIQLMPC